MDNFKETLRKNFFEEAEKVIEELSEENWKALELNRKMLKKAMDELYENDEL